nr:hypothetical protein MACL_00003337 [Theileria orientalis]
MIIYRMFGAVCKFKVVNSSVKSTSGVNSCMNSCMSTGRRWCSYYPRVAEGGRSTAETKSELSRLESVDNMVKNVDVLHNLIKKEIFVYDDRVKRALEELRTRTNKVGDYETLLKTVDIFYRTGDWETMKKTLSYFIKDVPYMPYHVLVELTRLFIKAHRNSSVTRALQSQLYLNACADRSSGLDVESILCCVDVIEDRSVVQRALEGVDFTKSNEYAKLYARLKLYQILLSTGGDGIEGFMVAAVRHGGTENEFPCRIDKYAVNCYRMLIKIRNYEPLDYRGISDAISSGYSYNTTDLALLLRDVYHCCYEVEPSVLEPIYRGVFDNMAQLSKDDVVLVFRVLSKYRPQITKTQMDLLNIQALLHMSEYTARDVLSIVNYYSRIPTSAEAVDLMEKLYSHLTDGSRYCIAGGNTSDTQCGDANVKIYTLSKAIMYLNSAQHGWEVRRKGQDVMSTKLKRYTRTIANNHINLTDKTVAYCLYTFYKVKHDPVKLIQQLMPSLERRLNNSVDLVQALLFFTRNRYSSFYAVLVSKVERKLASNELNGRQLVIVARCLGSYKKIFASQMFTAVNARLEEMSVSQVCTVFRAYAKSGLRNEALISALNWRVMRDLGSIFSKEAVNLLIPIKKGYITSERVVEYIKGLDLDPSDKFDVFGQVPKEGQLTDDQVVKCLLCLSKKERSGETDKFARELYSRVVKMASSLSEYSVRAILNAIQAYGYSKPKVKRVLTNRLRRHSGVDETMKRAGVTGATDSDRDKYGDTAVQRNNLLTFFRHISLGPPHLPLQNKLDIVIFVCGHTRLVLPSPLATKLTALLILVGNTTVRSSDVAIDDTNFRPGSGGVNEVYTLCGPWSGWTQCNHLNKQHRSRACTHKRGAVPDYSGKRGDLTPEERSSFDKYFSMLNAGQSGEYVQMPEIQTRACTSEDHELEEGMRQAAPGTSVRHIVEEVDGDVDARRSRSRSRTRSESAHSVPDTSKHRSDPRSHSADSLPQGGQGAGRRPRRSGFKARRDAREQKRVKRQEREHQRRIREEARNNRLASGVYEKYPLLKIRDVRESEDDAQQKKLDDLEARSDEEERERDNSERRKRKNRGAAESEVAETPASGGDRAPHTPETSGGAQALRQIPTSGTSETDSGPATTPAFEECAPWGDWTPCNDISKQHRFRLCKYKREYVPDYSSRLGDLTDSEKVKYAVVNQIASQYDDEGHVNKNDIETRACQRQGPKEHTPPVKQPATPSSSTVAQPESAKKDAVETAVKPSAAQPLNAQPPIDSPATAGEASKVDNGANKEDHQKQTKMNEGHPTVINGFITPVVRMTQQSRGHDLPPEVPTLSRESYEKLMKKFSPNLFKPLAVTNGSKIPVRKATVSENDKAEEAEEESSDGATDSSPLVPVSSEKNSLRSQKPRDDADTHSRIPVRQPVKTTEQKAEPSKQPAKTAGMTTPLKQPINKPVVTVPARQPVKKPAVTVPARQPIKPSTPKPNTVPSANPATSKPNTVPAATPVVSGADKATALPDKKTTTPAASQTKPLASAASKAKAPVKRAPSPKTKPSYKPRAKSPAPKPKPTPRTKPTSTPKSTPTTPKAAPRKASVSQPQKVVDIKAANSSASAAQTNLVPSSNGSPNTFSSPSKAGGDLPPTVPDMEARNATKRRGGDLPAWMPDINDKRVNKQHGGDLPPMVPEVTAESAAKKHGGDLPPMVPEAEAETPKPASEKTSVPNEPEAEADRPEASTLPQAAEPTSESTQQNIQDNSLPQVPEPAGGKTLEHGTQQATLESKLEELIKPKLGETDVPEPGRITVNAGGQSDKDDAPTPFSSAPSDVPQDDSQSTTGDLNPKESTKPVEEPVKPVEEPVKPVEKSTKIDDEVTKPADNELTTPDDDVFSEPTEDEPIKPEVEDESTKTTDDDDVKTPKVDELVKPSKDDLTTPTDDEPENLTEDGLTTPTEDGLTKSGGETVKPEADKPIKLDEELTKPTEDEPTTPTKNEPAKPEVEEPATPDDNELTKLTDDESIESGDDVLAEPVQNPVRPSENETTKPELEDETTKPIEDELETPTEYETTKPIEDYEGTYESPRIRIPVSEDSKADATQVADASQAKPALRKVEERLQNTDPTVHNIINEFGVNEATGKIKKPEAEAGKSESENTVRPTPAEEAKLHVVSEDLPSNRKEGDKMPHEPESVQEPGQESEEEGPNYDQTGDNSSKKDDKPQFNRGVTIAASIVGVILLLGAGGAGYHYTRKSKKRNLEPTDVEVVGFEETEEPQLEESETAVYITEEVWDS